MKWLRAFFCLMLFSGISLFQTGTGAALDFSPPSWIQINQVSEQMVINGLVSEVVHLVSGRPVSEVLEHFRRIWNCGTDTQQCKLVETPPWSIFSRLEGRKLTYVQIRTQGLETVGYVVSSQLKAITEQAFSIAHMQGSTIENSVSSTDGGRSATTMLVTNTFSLTTNKTHYANAFADQGWSKISDNATLQGDLVVFQKGTKEASLVFSTSSGQTNVVLSVTAKQ